MLQLSSILVTLPVLLLLIPLIFILTSVAEYFIDRKGFRKYPTQNWASGITGLAYGWECGRLHKETHTKRLHQALQKQSVIRIGPNWLSFGGSQAAKDIYGYTSKCVKAGIYDKMADGGANLNNISDNAYHSARRRMVASSYAPKNIEYWEPGVAASVIALKDVLDQRCARPKSQEMIQPEELNFDAVRWIYLFSMECLIKIVLSRDVFFVRNGTDHIYFKDKNGDSRAIQALHSTHAGQRAACTIIWDMDRFGFWQKVTNRLSKWYADNWQAGADFHTVMEALAIERMERHANGEYLYDLFQPMIEDVKGNEADMTMGDRIADVEQAVGAGTDGPAGSIIMTLYYLLRNPDTFHKLRTELDSVLSPTDAVAPWHKIKNLPYLHACIDESMRLSPPVATDLIRRTPPDRTTVIGGEVIPPSTNVSISAYTAHRDPIVFKDPEVFDPSRWMAKGTDQLREMLGIYIPFSAGVRGCIGRNVTILIQSVCIASLVYHYEFTLPHKDWEIELEEYFNAWPLKMPLKVWRRDEDSFVKA